MRERYQLRIRILYALVLIVAVVLVGRLYLVQVVYGDEFAEKADRQYVQQTHDRYDRGTIFLRDRDERLIAGATVKSGFLLGVNSRLVEDAEASFAQLPESLAIDREDYLARATKEDDPHEIVAREVETELAEAIRTLELPGHFLQRERWRYYPGGSLAAHAIGFVAYDGDTRRGQYGLERTYDDVLSREAQNLHVNFFAEIFSNLGEFFAAGRERDGDVVTALEPSVQLKLERTLADMVKRWGSKSAGGIVIDPKTGAVYALAAHPTFDLNRFNEVDDVARYGNPVVGSVYEMGSIIKPITMAIGLDSGAVTPGTIYNDRGELEVDGYTIRNFDGRGRGRVSMQEVLNQSLNTGASFVAREVGTEEFARYLHEFGLGERTGIDLPSEAEGLIHNLDSPRMVEFATASFGQGIALTPIATARALSALANGGELVTPHIATKLLFKSGAETDLVPTERTRVISEEASEDITRMLVDVVDEALLGGTVAKENYAIAAKTGTAQIAMANERGYYDDRFLHSFFGYFPAYEPRFLVFLYHIEPRGARYASQTLTEPFMELTDYLINYYEIPPDR